MCGIDPPSPHLRLIVGALGCCSYVRQEASGIAPSEVGKLKIMSEGLPVRLEERLVVAETQSFDINVSWMGRENNRHAYDSVFQQVVRELSSLYLLNTVPTLFLKP